MVKIAGMDKNKAEEILQAKTPAEVLEFYNSPYSIQDEEIRFYEKNGYVKLKKVIEEPALKYLREFITAAVYIRKKKDRRRLAEKTEYEQSFLQCGYLCWDYPSIKDYVLGKRFAGIARDLMQVSGVRLWHDQALFKEPNGRATPIHQDSSYWPVKEPQYTTTLWLALNDITKNMGCLYFYPGTHDLEFKEYVDIFQNPHTPKILKERQKVSVPLNAGDATFHSGLTFHGTDENQTNKFRKGMTTIFINDGAVFNAGDERNATHTSCIGLKDGEKIDTKFTPLIV